MSSPTRQRERRLELKASGLCTKCGKESRGVTRLVCDICWSKPYYRYTPEKHVEDKLKVFEAYGGCYCNCCGQGNQIFLSVDHIKNDGAKHRQSMYKTIQSRPGGNIYTWLIARNYPEGFQVLCHNCNMGRYVNGGICPHKETNVQIS